MSDVRIKVTDMGTIVVKIGESLYTFPLHKIIHFRDWYFRMEKRLT